MFWHDGFVAFFECSIDYFLIFWYNNITVYIGDESGIENDVTVIKTKFKRNNEEGTIAIIGPKRMDYDRVMSMLEYMKENIER